MIKKATGYKLFCDACGKNLGGVFGSKETATVYAIMSGYYLRKYEQFYCSFMCRNILIRQANAKVKKGGDNVRTNGK